MEKKKEKKRAQLDPLEAIKRLLMIQSLSQGVSPEVIAQALEITPGRISQIVSVKEVKPKISKN